MVGLSTDVLTSNPLCLFIYLFGFVLSSYFYVTTLLNFLFIYLRLAWISSDYFESLLLPQLLRGENDSKQSDKFQANLRFDLTTYFYVLVRRISSFASEICD